MTRQSAAALDHLTARDALAAAEADLDRARRRRDRAYAYALAARKALAVALSGPPGSSGRRRPDVVLWGHRFGLRTIDGRGGVGVAVTVETDEPAP